MRFAPGWDIVVHVVDVAFFALWVLLPDTPANPLVVYYVFVVVCATLRWQTTGTCLDRGVGTSAMRLLSFLARRCSATPIG